MTLSHAWRLVPALFLLNGAWSECAETPRKPNILLIYSDDHGWADLGAQGADNDVRTPHLDQLAADGVRFTRGYVSAPQCVPSRAGLLTGRYQQKFGVEDNNKGPLPLKEVTLAERLKPAGYLSGFIGKSHLDLHIDPGPPQRARLQADHLPHHQGFDEYFRGEMNQYHASHDREGNAYKDAPRIVKDKRFRVEVQTEAALAFLDRREKTPTQPWFLYLAWYAPHVPLESPEPWFSRTPTHLPKERRQALAMIAAMDDGLGKIRAKLQAMKQAEQTLIVFIGDNGAPLKAGAWNGSINQPLTGEKGMLTDGGIRTPFVMAWPGTIPAGRKCEQPVINLDVAATARAMAGLPMDPILDGANLLPYLKGIDAAPPQRPLYWRWRSQAAVLEHPWKLILLGNGEAFLFHLEKPGGEDGMRNRISDEPEIASRLRKTLDDWSQQLQPPGLPQSLQAEDAKFYRDHVNHPAQEGP